MKLKYDIVPYGEHALLMNFEQIIDPTLNHAIHSLVAFIEREINYGIVSVIPAYCSLTIVFNPRYISFQELRSGLEQMMRVVTYRNDNQTPLVRIPVCYHPDFGLDLAELSSELQLSVDDIIDTHTSSEYMVYMLGFMPGFPFMGQLDPRLETMRKAVPRKNVPKNSVAIAGLQTGIYPNEGPGGWQVIGRVPFDIYNITSMDSATFEAGMRVQFYPINRREFDSLRISDNKTIQL